MKPELQKERKKEENLTHQKTQSQTDVYEKIGFSFMHFLIKRVKKTSTANPKPPTV